MNRFWIILAVVVVGLAGIFFLTKPDDNSDGGSGGEDPAKITEVDHIKWNDQATVTLIEYGDFQCPGCGSYHPIIKQLEADYGEKVRFVFRHFPLRNIHPNAQAAALAAEAASKQGKFWEMHDKLFETQQSWGRVSSNLQTQFEDYAKELGLDMDKFKTDYTDPGTAQRINDDLKTGQALGAVGTPTFVLNGEKIETPANAEAFSAVLDAAIQKADQPSNDD